MNNLGENINPSSTQDLSHIETNAGKKPFDEQLKSSAIDSKIQGAVMSLLGMAVKVKTDQGKVYYPTEAARTWVRANVTREQNLSTRDIKKLVQKFLTSSKKEPPPSNKVSSPPTDKIAPPPPSRVGRRELSSASEKAPPKDEENIDQLLDDLDAAVNAATNRGSAPPTDLPPELPSGYASAAAPITSQDAEEVDKEMSKLVNDMKDENNRMNDFVMDEFLNAESAKMSKFFNAETAGPPPPEDAPPPPPPKDAPPPPVVGNITRSEVEEGLQAVIKEQRKEDVRQAESDMENVMKAGNRSEVKINKAKSDLINLIKDLGIFQVEDMAGIKSITALKGDALKAKLKETGFGPGVADSILNQIKLLRENGVNALKIQLDDNTKSITMPLKDVLSYLEKNESFTNLLKRLPGLERSHYEAKVQIASQLYNIKGMMGLIHQIKPVLTELNKEKFTVDSDQGKMSVKDLGQLRKQIDVDGYLKAFEKLIKGKNADVSIEEMLQKMGTKQKGFPQLNDVLRNILKEQVKSSAANDAEKDVLKKEFDRLWPTGDTALDQTVNWNAIGEMVISAQDKRRARTP